VQKSEKKEVDCSKTHMNEKNKEREKGKEEGASRRKGF
jgi:hypothetical protein